MVYIMLLHEPGPVFYPFAALVFFGGPLIAGMAGAARCCEHKYRAFLISGGTVFAAALVFFFMNYAVLPHFDRTSVSCRSPATAFPADHILLLRLPTNSRAQEPACWLQAVNRQPWLRWSSTPGRRTRAPFIS